MFDYNGNPVGALNVKLYGASGNGTASDSSAIQSALDKMHDGGIIYFPKGTYLITNHIYFYSNQILLFERGATLKQGGEIDNLLMSYCRSEIEEYNGVHDSAIIGATFDGGDYVTNNTLLGIVHAKNITIKNCKFINAYGTWHNLEINASYNTKVIDCYFEGTRKTGANGELLQLDAMSSSGTWPWGNANVDNTPCKFVEISGCVFSNCDIAPAMGNHSSGTSLVQFVNIHDNVFENLTASRAQISFQSGADIDVHSNVFNSCTNCIGNNTHVFGNRFVNVTTVGGTNVHDNMINGTFTA